MFEKVKCSTPDFAEENVAKLLKLFPEVEGEKGEVDLDKLRQVLSSKVVEGNVERYEFTWPGKRAAKAAASAATTKTLRPCREESVDFDTPKPTKLIYQLLDMSTKSGDLVLDFFSGSAASAHTVMQSNAQDVDGRKFIMVQLPEVCPDDSEAAKAGYENICEIGKERIRRAGKKIVEELKAKQKEKEGELDFGGDGAAGVCALPDIGFRVLKLDSSSLNDTSATASETTQEFANFNRIKSGPFAGGFALPDAAGDAHPALRLD